MRKALKIGLLSVGVAGLLTVVFLPQIAGWLAPDLIKQKYGERFASQIELHSVSTSWFGAATIDGLAITDDNGKVLARVATIEVPKSFGSLIWSALFSPSDVVKAARIKGLALTLEIDDAGKSNIPDLMAALRRRENGESKMLAEKLADLGTFSPVIYMDDASLTIKDELNKCTSVVSPIQGSFSVLSSADDALEVGLTLDASVSSQKDANRIHVALQARQNTQAVLDLLELRAFESRQIGAFFPQGKLDVQLEGLDIPVFSALSTLYNDFLIGAAEALVANCLSELKTAAAELRELRNARDEFGMQKLFKNTLVPALSQYNVRAAVLAGLRLKPFLVPDVIGEASSFQVRLDSLVGEIETLSTRLKARSVLLAYLGRSGMLAALSDAALGLHLQLSCEPGKLACDVATASIILPASLHCVQEQGTGTALSDIQLVAVPLTKETFSRQQRRLELGLKDVSLLVKNEPQIHLQEGLLDLSELFNPLLLKHMGASVTANFDYGYLKALFQNREALRPRLSSELASLDERLSTLFRRAAPALAGSTDVVVEDYSALLGGACSVTGGVQINADGLKAFASFVAPELVVTDAYARVSASGESLLSQKMDFKLLPGQPVLAIDTESLQAGLKKEALIFEPSAWLDALLASNVQAQADFKKKLLTTSLGDIVTNSLQLEAGLAGCEVHREKALGPFSVRLDGTPSLDAKYMHVGRVASILKPVASVLVEKALSADASIEAAAQEVLEKLTQSEAAGRLALMATAEQVTVAIPGLCDNFTLQGRCEAIQKKLASVWPVWKLPAAVSFKQLVEALPATDTLAAHYSDVAPAPLESWRLQPLVLPEGKDLGAFTWGLFVTGLRNTQGVLLDEAHILCVYDPEMDPPFEMRSQAAHLRSSVLYKEVAAYIRTAQEMFRKNASLYNRLLPPKILTADPHVWPAVCDALLIQLSKTLERLAAISTERSWDWRVHADETGLHAIAKAEGDMAIGDLRLDLDIDLGQKISRLPELLEGWEAKPLWDRGASLQKLAQVLAGPYPGTLAGLIYGGIKLEPAQQAELFADPATRKAFLLEWRLAHEDTPVANTYTVAEYYAMSLPETGAEAPVWTRVTLLERFAALVVKNPALLEQLSEAVLLGTKDYFTPVYQPYAGLDATHLSLRLAHASLLGRGDVIRAFEVNAARDASGIRSKTHLEYSLGPILEVLALCSGCKPEARVDEVVAAINAESQVLFEETYKSRAGRSWENTQHPLHTPAFLFSWLAAHALPIEQDVTGLLLADTGLALMPRTDRLARSLWTETEDLHVTNQTCQQDLRFSVEKGPQGQSLPPGNKPYFSGSDTTLLRSVWSNFWSRYETDFVVSTDEGAFACTYVGDGFELAASKVLSLKLSPGLAETLLEPEQSLFAWRKNFHEGSATFTEPDLGPVEWLNSQLDNY